MAINWNIDIKSIGTLFKKSARHPGVSPVLIPSTQKIWRASILFLAIFALIAVAYDGYIFWEYVLNQQDVDIGDQGTVQGINRPLFDEVSKAIRERSARFEGAKLAEPLRNPFQPASK